MYSRVVIHESGKLKQARSNDHDVDLLRISMRMLLPHSEYRVDSIIALFFRFVKIFQKISKTNKIPEKTSPFFDIATISPAFDIAFIG
jgi:hypothetical protein